MNVVVCDIDGTLTKVGDRLKYLTESPKNWDAFYQACGEDEPNPWTIQFLYHFLTAPKGGNAVVFFTGRPERVRSETVKWIGHNCPFIRAFPLYMRGDDDYRPDHIVKPEYLKRNPLLLEHRLLFLEDRTSMVKKWRELGFTCWQVAEGDF